MMEPEAPDELVTNVVQLDQSVVRAMREEPRKLRGLYVNSNGLVIARFDREVKLVGKMPVRHAWMSGLQTEVIEFLTAPVQKSLKEEGTSTERLELFLRLKPLAQDTHALGHSFHGQRPVLPLADRPHTAGTRWNDPVPRIGGRTLARRTVLTLGQRKTTG